MSWVIDFVGQLGPILCLGSTLLLAVGASAILAARSPAGRQRLGELAIAGTLAWMVLACLPLRRLNFSLRHATDTSTESPLARSDREFDESPSSRGSAHDAFLPIETSGNSVSTLEPPRGDQRVPADTAGPGPRESAHHGPWLARRLQPPAMAMLYVVGAVLGCLWLILGRVLLARVEMAALEPPEWIREAYENLAVTRRARLLVSPRTRRPFSYGVLRPTIMLPADISNMQHARPVRHVLLHEQSHIQRRDAWGNALLNLAFPLLYLNPLYWWIRSRVQLARELIADDWATSGGSKSAYAEDLLQLFRGRDVSLAGPIGVMGVFRLRSPLARRMKMLLQREDQLSTRLSRPWLAAAAASSLGLVLMMSSVLGLRLASAGDDGRASDSSVLDRSDAARGPAERSESYSADESNQFQPRSDATSESDIKNLVSADTGETVGANAAPGTENTSASWRGTVGRSASRSKTTISGLVTPIVSAKIPARVQGQVASIHVKEGSRVKAGQLLVRIDDELAQLETKAKAHAADASEAMAKSDIRVQVARKAAELTKVDLDEALDASRRVPQSISAYEMRRKEFTAARQRLEVNHAEVELEVARATHAQQLFDARAAKAMLTRYRIAAPFDGVVSKLHVDASSWVEPGDLICQLVRLDRVRVEGYVDTADYNPEDLHGRQVTVTVARARSRGVIVGGKVSYVSVDVDAVSGHFRFFTDVHNPLKDGVYLIRPGMRAVIDIAASPEPRRTIQDGAAESSGDAAEQEPLDSAEIAYLTELVEAYQATWKRIHALQQAGAPGGEANNEAASRHRLCLARARLALARGDRAEAIKHYEVAVKAAETRVESCQAAYDSGALTLDRVMDAQAERAETKLQLNRLKR